MFTDDVCGLHRQIQDSNFHDIYAMAWLSVAVDFIKNLRELCKYYELLSSHLSSFIKRRLGEEFPAFLDTIYQKFRDFVHPGLISVPAENFVASNLAKESDGGSSGITYMGNKTSFGNKEEYNCDRYSPVCRFFQQTTELIVDFPTTIKTATTRVMEAASIFMKEVIEDFPGLVKNIDLLPYASIRYVTLAVSAFKSKIVTRIFTGYVPVVKMFTLMSSKDQVRRIFDFHAQVYENIVIGIKTGLQDSRMGYLIPVFEKFQRSEIQPFVRNLQENFKNLKCHHVFPSSFCNKDVYERCMREIWEFVQNGEFQHISQEGLKYASRLLHLVSFDSLWYKYVIPICKSPPMADTCKAFVKTLDKVSQVGVEEVKQFFRWVLI